MRALLFLKFAFFTLPLIFSCLFYSGITQAQNNANSSNFIFNPILDPRGHSINNIRRLLQDDRGFLWIGGDDGVFRFDGHALIQVNENPTREIFIDSTGMIWSAGTTTLMSLDPESYQPTYYPHLSNKEDKPKIEIIHDMIETQSKRHFFGTDEGISEYIRKNNSFLNYQLTLNNMASQTISVISFYQLENGKLMLGTSLGLFIVSEEIFNTDFKIELSKSIISGVKIKDITKNKNNQYVIGSDNGLYIINDHFEIIKHHPTAIYTNLPSGSYTFSVKAKDLTSNWGQEGYHFIITSSPAWSWWALSIYGLIAYFVIFVLVRFRTRQLAKQSKYLERKITERTTELDQNKNKVELLMREKEKLIENIYHQTKTPMQLMLGNISLLKSNKIALSDYCSKQIHEIFKLSKLTEKVLNITQNDYTPKLKKQLHNISEIARPILLSFKDIANIKNISFDWETDSKIVTSCHATDFEKLLENIIENGIKYTNNGWVKLRLYQLHRHIIIDCSDSGIGIPDVDQKNIFNRYYRASNSEKIEGAGIGLAMVSEIVESYQGNIFLQSQVNSGTKIRIKLPINNNQSSIDATPAKIPLVQPMQNDAVHEFVKDASLTPTADKKPCILIVEDNLELSVYLKSILETQYQVAVSLDGENGLAKAISLVPDLIISDIMMGEMDGYKFTRQIRENRITNHIPLLLITAKSDTESRYKGFSVGANDFITKPFNETVLLDRIQNQLSHVSKIQRAFIDNTQLHGSQSDDKIITAYLKFVSQNFSNCELMIKDICEELHISTRQLERKIKHFLDISPNEYLNEYRLARAQELVKNGETIKTIYANCGFSSQSYFSKRYKQKFGVKPSDDRINTTT